MPHPLRRALLHAKVLETMFSLGIEMALIEIKVPDIGDFAEVTVIELMVKPGDAGLFIERRGFLVDGRTAEFTQSWYRGDAAAAAVFAFEDDVRYVYDGSWCAPGAETSWNGDWRFIGPKGTLLNEKDQGSRGEVVAGSDGFHVTKKPLKIPVDSL